MMLIQEDAAVCLSVWKPAAGNMNEAPGEEAAVDV